MLTLNEISKKAEELYNKFESDYNRKFENTTSELFTDDEIIDILIDELSEPNYESELLYTQHVGHYDEQALENYRYAKNEDGEYIHRLNKPINGYSD